MEKLQWHFNRLKALKVSEIFQIVTSLQKKKRNFSQAYLFSHLIQQTGVDFGEITIGDNVIIGANSVINKSVPANGTVVGNQFRIVASNRAAKYYEMDEENKGMHWSFWFK